MPDPVYVVAGAVRIQAWIARTPDLRLSRGASRALAELTGATHIDSALPSSGIAARRARDAADIDGVVVLQVQPAGDGASEVTDAVRWLRCQLGESLPGVEWQVWAHQAPTYIAAYQVATGGAEVSHGRWRFLPTDGEIPLAETCEGCASESAIESRDVVDVTKRLGPDCVVRLDHTRGLAENRAWDFDTLAKSGGVAPDGSAPTAIGRRDAANHLATIAADGNRVGALFTELAGLKAREYQLNGEPTTIQERVSKQLAAATRLAVDEASLVGAPAAKLRCVIDHLIGGDDVLVSVAARFAWTYVQALVEEFNERFTRAIEDVLSHAHEAGAIDDEQRVTLRQLADKVSLSVGMVFANRKHPIAHCTDVAHDQLKSAKRSGRGRAAISWMDLTVEHQPTDGGWISGDELLTPPTVPANASARATLAGAIRDMRRTYADRAAPGDRPTPEETAELIAMVRAWCRRTEHGDLLAEDATADDLSRLENDLDRARWWPEPERTTP